MQLITLFKDFLTTYNKSYANATGEVCLPVDPPSPPSNLYPSYR